MLNPFQASQVKSTSFLPEDYVARRAQTRFTIAIMALWMIVMVGMGGAFWLINGAWKVLRTRQEGVSTEYAQESARLDQLKQLESQRAAIMGKADITAALIERVPRYAMLGELSLRRPADLKLDTFELKSTRIAPPAPPAPTANGKEVKNLTDKAKEDAQAFAAKSAYAQLPKFQYALMITGSAKQNKDVADYLSSLKKSPIFQKVELTYIKETKQDEQVLRKFEITASLRSDVAISTLDASLEELKKARLGTKPEEKTTATATDLAGEAAATAATEAVAPATGK
jgi:Tfp pilus assembly protein PilN